MLKSLDGQELIFAFCFQPVSVKWCGKGASQWELGSVSGGEGGAI